MGVIVEGLVAVGGTAIGIIGIYMAWRERRVSEQNNRIAAAATVTAWFGELRSWASDGVDILAEASYSGATLKDEAHVRKLKHRLSSVIDRGRFFFPNLPYVKGGQEVKPTAYKGSRHAVLDPLVAAISILESKLGRYGTQEEGLKAMQREFVSRVQQVLNPHESNQRIEALVSASREVKGGDRTLGGLIETHHAPGEHALLNGEG